MKNLSVIIPVRNGAQTLEACLESIRAQEDVGEVEIIVLDSMSTDSSRLIAKRYGCIIVEIPTGTFNHGLTRNLGANLASGELVMMTVQDARLKDKDALSKMVAHFQNEEIMGVVGHQAIPKSRLTNPIYWYNPQTKPVVSVRKVENGDEFQNWGQEKKRLMFAWDDVIAMYRKSAILELPFVKTDFAEDWIWCAQALKKGWALAYDPGIVTYHYHHRTFKYVFQTHLILNHHLAAALEVLPICPNLFRQIPMALYRLYRNNAISSKEKIFWFLHVCGSQLADLLSYLFFMLAFSLKGKKGSAWLTEKWVPNIPQGSLLNNVN